MGSHQWRGSSLLALLLQAHKDLRPAPARSLRCQVTLARVKMYDLPAFQASANPPPFLKTLIQRCFQPCNLCCLFMLSIKIESYPLLFDVTAFQFRLLKHFIDLVWAPSTAFSHFSQWTNRHTKVKNLTQCLLQMRRLKRPCRALKSWCSNCTHTQPLYAGDYFYKSLYTLAGQGGHVWQCSTVTCWNLLQSAQGDSSPF